MLNEKRQTMKSKVPSKGWSALVVIPLFLIFSCSTVEVDCDENGTCPVESVIERLDLAVSGDFEFREQTENAQGDKSVDLVSFNIPANPGTVFSISMQLSNGHVIRLQVVDAYYGNPWEQVGMFYGTYPTQDLEDKWSYVTAHYFTGAETAAYSSNLGTNLPPTADPDVLEITESSLTEFRCRIRNLVLYNNIDPSKTLYVSGTFKGAASYLQ